MDIDLDTIQREHALETYYELEQRQLSSLGIPERRVQWDDLIFSLYKRGYTDATRAVRIAWILLAIGAAAMLLGLLQFQALPG